MTGTASQPLEGSCAHMQKMTVDIAHIVYMLVTREQIRKYNLIMIPKRSDPVVNNPKSQSPCHPKTQNCKHIRATCSTQCEERHYDLASCYSIV